MAKQKSTNTKRIPVGTRVRWQTEPGYGEVHDGIVTEFDAQMLCYVVKVNRTRTGRPRPEANVKTMRPWASRLEAQNPDALK
jgi:hypothetical protein